MRDMLNLFSKRYVNGTIVGQVIHIFVAWVKKLEIFSDFNVGWDFSKLS